MRMGKARPAEAFGREEKPAGMFPREEEARDSAGKGPLPFGGEEGAWRGSRRLERLRLAFGRAREPAGISRGERRGIAPGKGPLPFRRGRRGVAGVALLGKVSPAVRTGAESGGDFQGRKARDCAGKRSLRFGGEEGAWRGTRCLGRLRLPSGRARKAAGDFQGRKARDCVGKGPFAVWRGKRGVAGDALLGKVSPAVWAGAESGGALPMEREAGIAPGRGLLPFGGEKGA